MPTLEVYCVYEERFTVTIKVMTKGVSIWYDCSRMARVASTICEYQYNALLSGVHFKPANLPPKAINHGMTIVDFMFSYNTSWILTQVNMDKL